MSIILRDLKYQIKKFILPLSGLSLIYLFIIYLSNLNNKKMSIMEGFFIMHTLTLEYLQI